MLTTVAHLVGGWCSWSFCHYWVHRGTHLAMARGAQGSGPLEPAVTGESKHHLHYDRRSPGADNDPERQWITFPIRLGLPLVALATLFYIAAAGFCAGTAYAVGVLISMLIDDRIHRRNHERYGEHPRAFTGRWHDAHHDSYARLRRGDAEPLCNFSFCTGLIWDVLFATARAPKRSDREDRSPVSGKGQL